MSSRTTPPSEWRTTARGRQYPLPDVSQRDPLNSGTSDILNTAAGLEESGRHSCSSGQSSDPDRRVLVAAAVDCSALPPGNASNVPVWDFYRIFMTNVAGAPDPADVWVEVIDHVDPFGGGPARSRVRP